MRGSPKTNAEKDARARSEFLRGQMNNWMEDVSASGKTKELFELEMWLRSFERFFRIRNQPLSERETRQLALRNWSEELRLVDNVVLRANKLCTVVLSEERVDRTRFDHYVESYLKRDDTIDPYVSLLLRDSTPEAGLTLLREAFEDIHRLLGDLVKLAQLPYSTFSSVGRIINREVRRSPLVTLLIEEKFKPVHDRIRSPALATTIRGILSASDRKQAARTFLELFRLLHYLEYADPSQLGDEELKNTILIFSLITADTRNLLGYLERKVMRTLAPEEALYSVYDSFVYTIPLELRKVLHAELLDIAAFRQRENIRARVENSHGILKGCFQQSIVQLAQVFDDEIRGGDIFPDFITKRDQSLALQQSLAQLVDILGAFQQRPSPESALELKGAVSRFYDTQMARLMYRDWTGFELFYIELLKCVSLTGLQQIAHRFEAFLHTLHREVQKRAVLSESQ